MSHGWDTRTVIETAVSHRWARRIQHEPPILAAARNVLIALIVANRIVANTAPSQLCGASTRAAAGAP